MSGLDLSRRFYRQVVRPLLGELPHAAALLGHGSEVLGYDDDVSTDHDFGPRLQLFLPEHVDTLTVAGLLGGLPEQFEAMPVAFSRTGRHDGRAVHQVEVTSAEAFFSAQMLVDPVQGLSLADWLLTPTQVLATLTGGAVFHDPAGELAQRRAVLRWYPDDIWRYALAAAWLRVGQEEAFIGRAGARGDDLGSRMVAARLVRELVRLAFLIERRWAPYSKWLGRVFADLRLAEPLTPHLDSAVAAVDWREREAAVCAGASVLARATNDLGLCTALDPAPRRFHGRDIQVIGGEAFTTALTAAIADADALALLDRLGSRKGNDVGALPGTIDQAVDSTDILSHPARCRAAAALLGLPCHTGSTN